jgi:hypothetical protein
MRYNEQRCLSYLSILNGAKGIVLYVGRSWCEAKNKQYPKISAEMNVLSPVILENDDEGDIDVGTKGITARYYKYKGNYWIVCANALGKELKGVELKLDKIIKGSSKAESVFIGDEKVIEGGIIKLDFKPYDCFVYQIVK